MDTLKTALAAVAVSLPLTIAVLAAGAAFGVREWIVLF